MDIRLVIKGLKPLCMDPGVWSSVETVYVVSKAIFFGGLGNRVVDNRICLSVGHPIPSALGALVEAIDVHSPFLCRCHGMCLGSVEVVVPRDGADGHGGGSSGGDIESSALGGMCLACCGCGALQSKENTISIDALMRCLCDQLTVSVRWRSV